MDFGTNKTPADIIKEGAFGGTYFRDIYSGIKGKRYRKSWKESNVLKNIDQKYYCSNYYVASVNKYGVKCATSLRFWKIKDGLILWILMVGFSGILEIVYVEDL